MALLGTAARRRAQLLALVAALAANGGAYAQPLEYEVKAAFLYNFTQFTEWPAAAFADPKDPFHICLAGASGLAPLLELAAEGERVATHRIVVEVLNGDDTGARCHLLFVSRDETRRTVTLVRDSTRALLVGESPDFLSRGGMINFVIDGGRVRFDVNTAAAAARGLRLSSRLLRIARHTALPSQ